MLSDRIGRMPVIMKGLFIFVSGSIIAALTDSIFFLIFARFIQGYCTVSFAIFAFISDQTLFRDENKS